MSRAVKRRYGVLYLCMSLFIVASGMDCPPGSEIPGGDPTVPEGDRPPRMFISSIQAPSAGLAEQGQAVTIRFNASDAEAGADGKPSATAKVFASTNSNPTSAQQILIPPVNTMTGTTPILENDPRGSVVWDTTSVPVGTYHIFGEVDDQTFDLLTGTGNRPVRVTASTLVQIAPMGSQPLPKPPAISFPVAGAPNDNGLPVANLGLSSEDEVTVRYRYLDADSAVKVTLLLDKDLIPTNDDVNNPGDPLDPNSKIIILPSSARVAGDPTFADATDTAEVRTNPRNLPLTATLRTITYIFKIDFARIPERSVPYFIRATISDGNTVSHAYSIGSVTITALGSGFVDLGDIGFSIAGGRFQGFSQYENLGSDFVGTGDQDSDRVGDFMLASRFGRPLNRNKGPGSAYLIFGRRKAPFPADADGDGIPDGFLAPPTFMPEPYGSQNVGRFGGILNVNSTGSFFRGITYAMPVSNMDPSLGGSNTGNPANVPPALQDEAYPYTNFSDPINSAGLTSITRIDVTDDGIPDLVFGLPYCTAKDHIDDDPSDAGCDDGLDYSTLPDSGAADGMPNAERCNNTTKPTNKRERAEIGDNLAGGGDPWAFVGIRQGMVIVVDGATDIRTKFPRFVDAGIAGQFDPVRLVDDENAVHDAASTPNGLRFRGGWIDTQIVNVNNGPDTRVIDDVNEFGTTVAALPSIDNDQTEELIISEPGYRLSSDATTSLQMGRIVIYRGSKWDGDHFAGPDGVLSIPTFETCPAGCKVNQGPGNTQIRFCCRAFHVPAFPETFIIFGIAQGDRLGYASSAGQFNQDSTPDILCGAPGADPVNVNNAGIAYIVLTPNGGFGASLITDLPRVEIRGTHPNDKFGENQSTVGDLNGDGVGDVAIASEYYDDAQGADQGFVGIIYGNRPITGENGFAPEDIGTPILRGIRFLGRFANSRAGHRVSSAGDFNHDGYGDLLITCPKETFNVAGQIRLGVVYLIFGGPHLDPVVMNNNVHNLSEVGTAALPGIVFYGRVQVGVNDDNAVAETAKGIGDIDGDGFDDIAIGSPKCDFVYGLSPNQRRVDAGEVYIIYGSNFGTNNFCNVPGYCCAVGCP